MYVIYMRTQQIKYNPNIAPSYQHRTRDCCDTLSNCAVEAVTTKTPPKWFGNKPRAHVVPSRRRRGAPLSEASHPRRRRISIICKRTKTRNFLKMTKLYRLAAGVIRATCDLAVKISWSRYEASWLGHLVVWWRLASGSVIVWYPSS